MGEPFDFRDKSQVRNELTAAAEVASGDRADQAGHGTLQRFGSRAGQLVGAVQMASAACVFAETMRPSAMAGFTLPPALQIMGWLATATMTATVVAMIWSWLQ